GLVERRGQHAPQFAVLFRRPCMKLVGHDDGRRGTMLAETFRGNGLIAGPGLGVLNLALVVADAGGTIIAAILRHDQRYLFKEFARLLAGEGSGLDERAGRCFWPEEAKQD